MSWLPPRPCRSEVDQVIRFGGIPAAAWNYKLGNRSDLECVLDKWKKHKEKVIDLLHRVCNMNAETMKIILTMPA